MNASNLQQLIADWQPRLSRISETDSQSIVGTKWTRKQTLGHLIDSAANNHQRFVRLQQGNLAGFPGYDQELWVNAGNYNLNTWSNLVDLWSQYNRQLAIVIENVDPGCKTNVWEDRSFSLEFLIDDYVRHLLHHLEQLDKRS
ncbi:MAG: DinB family protein [Candidatus Kryptoniota bacterium]